MQQNFRRLAKNLYEDDHRKNVFCLDVATDRYSAVVLIAINNGMKF